MLPQYCSITRNGLRVYPWPVPVGELPPALRKNAIANPRYPVSSAKNPPRTELNPFGFSK